jgi:hypothetical protein
VDGLDRCGRVVAGYLTCFFPRDGAEFHGGYGDGPG